MEKLQAQVAALEAEQAHAWNAAAVAWNAARPLVPSEVQALELTNCRTAAAGIAWHDAVRLVVPSGAAAANFGDVSAILRAQVSHTTFGRNVVLIVSAAENDNNNNNPASPKLPTDLQALPTGCHANALISDSVIDLQARCSHNQVIRRTLLMRNAALTACGHVTCPTAAPLAPLTVEVGPESGGVRPLCLPAAATMQDVTNQMVDPAAVKARIMKQQQTQESSNGNRKQPAYNIILPGSWIRQTPTVAHVTLHAGAYIQAATAVTRTWLFPDAYIGNACTVSDCILQWKAHVVNHSTVEHVFFMECAAAGPHTFSSNAVLGPDVHISTGEVHASILGPNTNAHHQSLCIGVLWPHGRGNIGYGANVGSNHTGRLPDQEIAAAEGCFWGLSAVIAMPVNLCHAPYSVVAAGTTLSSTRVNMPFSLLQTGTIVPGWVYSKSPYTIVRSAHKYATRRKAVRHAYYTGWDILRPSIVQMAVVARQGLLQHNAQDKKKAYDGLGNLKCNDRGRALGVKTYTDLVQRYALQELLRLCLQYQKGGSAQDMVQNVTLAVQQAASSFDLGRVLPPCPFDWAPFPWDEDASQDSMYRRALCVSEFPFHNNIPPKVWIRQGLERLRQLETDFCQAVYTSKARDDSRGAAIIPQYEAAHVAAGDDPVIHRTRKELQTLQEQLDKLLAQLPASAL